MSENIPKDEAFPEMFKNTAPQASTSQFGKKAFGKQFLVVRKSTKKQKNELIGDIVSESSTQLNKNKQSKGKKAKELTEDGQKDLKSLDIVKQGKQSGLGHLKLDIKFDANLVLYDNLRPLFIQYIHERGIVPFKGYSYLSSRTKRRESHTFPLEKTLELTKVYKQYLDAYYKDNVGEGTRWDTIVARLKECKNSEAIFQMLKEEAEAFEKSQMEYQKIAIKQNHILPGVKDPDSLRLISAKIDFGKETLSQILDNDLPSVQADTKTALSSVGANTEVGQGILSGQYLPDVPSKIINDKPNLGGQRLSQALQTLRKAAGEYCNLKFENQLENKNEGIADELSGYEVADGMHLDLFG
ncbi:hypothetical protein DFH27DRAFT_617382 [Peziza echinospora]|nr:hypothetical protein DFH27DRAFT_617382 [Peziza echinospora]